MRRALAAALIALAACASEHTVLDTPGGVITSCNDARVAPAGAACAFEDDDCRRASAANPECCTERLTCLQGALAVEGSCMPACACERDAECGDGRLCSDRVCHACPDIDLVCSACPTGWVRLRRNGCETCACGPPPQCAVPGESCGPGSPDGQVCYAGKSCADGCDAAQPACCTNTCAAPSCSSPAPTGCSMDCPVGLACGQCAAQFCSCADGAWLCRPVCVDRHPLSCRVE